MAIFTMWLYLGSAIALALISLAIGAWAMFSDRARGRKRCCKCWYDMHAAASLRCPECGHDAQNEKQLYKTRRRWRAIAAAALVLLLACFLAIQPKVQPYGYASLTPVTALIVLSHFGDSNWAEEGLQYHMRYDLFHRPRMRDWYDPNDPSRSQAMWKWQWRVLGRRALDRIEVQEAPWPRRAIYQAWLAAARDLGNDEQLREACMRVLLQDLHHADFNVRRNAAWFMADSTDVEGSLQRIIALMDDDDDSVRHAAVRGVGGLARRSEQALQVLVDALEHEQDNVRLAALVSLGPLAGDYGHRTDVYERILALADDPNCDNRSWQIVTSSDWQQADEAWETITQAMQSEHVCIRRGGYIAAMRRWSEPDHVKRLILDGLSDTDVTVRIYAVRALADPLRETAPLVDYRAALEACLEDDNDVVRTGAAWILRRLDRQ